MGEMIPDLSREVAHLLESPAAYSAAGAAAAGVVGVAVAGCVERNRGSRDIQYDLKAAQQWVVDFLRDQRCFGGRDTADKFGLWRVRYRDSGKVAWISSSIFPAAYAYALRGIEEVEVVGSVGYPFGVAANVVFLNWLA
ncbi:hypothetical protein CQW23_12453 [Capsicum baccatum]|uniref:Uncharacterized protein n=1 Tax=Capsicum baccatum TaxID=33114 RepID=A0A2G2WSM6_CAPBA|nr:hypothetical protein CQW23_12453 [Capsicum baccatum]